MTEQKQEQLQPPQHQNEQPGREHKMDPQPEFMPPNYKGSEKLKNRVALITGGDSGIGRATAVLYAREGADVAIIYLEEDRDAQETQRLVEQEGRRCLLLAGDIGDEQFCKQAVERTVQELGYLDILVNNAAEQHPQKSITDISAEQLERTFRTNIYSMFFLVKAALEQIEQRKGVIINTTSVTAYRGSPELLDYSSTKGAIVAFTRSLSQALVEKDIRVNAVAPGPIWTPLIPSTFDAEKVATFGADVPMKRPGQPWEVGTCMVFLASNDSSYITGQVLHPNGGDVNNT